MNTKNAALIILAMAVFMFPTRAFSVSAGEFLLVDKGARASALAGAVGASAAGPFDFAYNPAGLGHQAAPTFGFEHNDWGLGMRGEYLAIACPLPLGSLAGALDYFSYGDIEAADERGNITGERVNAYRLGLKLGYGWSMSKTLALGATLDLYRETIGDYADLGTGVSLGTLWQSPWKGVAIGLGAKNLGFTRSGYGLPGSAFLGLAWSGLLDEQLALYLDSEYLGSDPGLRLAAGAEYRPLSWFVVRMGYGQPISSRDSVGLGLTGGLGLQWQEWQIGYATAGMGDVGLVHHLSLEYTIKPAAVVPASTSPAAGKTEPVKGGLKNEGSVLAAKPAQPAPPVQPVPPAQPAPHALSTQVEQVVKKRFDLGLKQYQQGNYSEAIREWKMVLELAPHHASVREYLQKAELVRKTEAEKYRQLARQANAQGDLIMEIQSLKKALAIYAEDPEASQGLKQAMEKAPGSVRKYYLAGLDLYSKGYYREAIQSWEKVLVLEPKHFKALEYIQKTKEKLVDLQ
jgi:tetratricopeptide (TPR) repeat protein